jgi:hypothetical protein
MTSHRLTVIFQADPERWRSFLARDDSGARPGLLRRVVYRGIDDPSEVMVELEFESAEAAKRYLPSLDLRRGLDEIGLDVYPPVFIGEEDEELRIEYG